MEGRALTVSVDGVTGTGTSLMDTGINYMFLSPPPGIAADPRAAGAGRNAPRSGCRGQAPPNATYSFTVGDWSNPLHPAKVEVVHDPGTFVNTGRMFLQGFDYLYDAAGGYVGYAGRTDKPDVRQCRDRALRLITSESKVAFAASGGFLTALATSSHAVFSRSGRTPALVVGHDHMARDQGGDQHIVAADRGDSASNVTGPGGESGMGGKSSSSVSRVASTANNDLWGIGSMISLFPPSA